VKTRRGHSLFWQKKRRTCSSSRTAQPAPSANQLPHGCSASGDSPNDSGKADNALLTRSSLRWREETAHLLPDEATANQRDQVISLGFFWGGSSQLPFLSVLTLSLRLSVYPLLLPDRQEIISSIRFIKRWEEPGGPGEVSRHCWFGIKPISLHNS
jgi:hypothetical protein